MARAETLELLGSLIEDLVPLGGMSPGRPIRAAEWNRLVDAVQTVARVAVARERTTDEFLDGRYSRIDHNHVGQIGLSWFDPRTRALLDENVSGAVEQRSSLKQVRDEVAQVRASVANLSRQLSELRIQLDGLRDSDSAREREVGRVAVRVEALRDVEVKVMGLDGRLGSIAGDVRAALAFRNELVDDAGQPINVRSFNIRIGELENLRRNLTLSNGTLVEIQEIERALARIEQNAIGIPDIDAAVIGRLRDPDTLEESGLVDTLRGQVETGLSPRLTALDQSVTGNKQELASVRADVNRQTARIDQHDARLTATDAAVGRLNGVPDRLTQQQALLNDFETRFQANQAATSDLPAIRAQLAQARTDITGMAGLRATVTQIESRVAAVEADRTTINQLVTTTGDLARRVGTVEGSLPGLQQTSATVTRHAATLADLNTRLTAGEAQLDNLAALPGITDALSTRVQGLVQFQATATQRLNELTTRTSNITTMADRLTAVERVGAENRNSLARMADDVTTLRSRVDNVEGRRLPNPRPEPIG